MKRGQVYWADLDPVRGREQAGRRPVLIVSANQLNRLPLVVTVVIGTKAAAVSENYRTNVRVAAGEASLPADTVFLCFQVRSIDRTRLSVAPLGEVTSETMNLIDDALRLSLAL